MRRTSALLGAVALALVCAMGVSTPAQAARSIKATVSAGCPADEVMTAAKFSLSKVTPDQKISVQTELSTLTPTRTSFAAGLAIYEVALNAKFVEATTTVPDAWTGQFELTAATCDPRRPAVINAQGSVCGLSPQLSVRLTNNNSIMVAYTVSVSSLATQPKKVMASRTEEVVFENVVRGKSYQISAEGNDGTRSTAAVTIPACAPAASPTPSPSPSKKDSPSPTPSASPTPSPTPSPSSLATEEVVASDITTEPAVQAVPDLEEKSFASSPKTWAWVIGCFMIAMGVVALIVVVRRSRNST